MQQSCKQCSAPFEVTQDDLAFYAKVSPVIAGKRYDIPAPKLCPDCRQQRRLSWRNERHLYHRKCELTGKSVITNFGEHTGIHVYDAHEWWTDKWDPKSYGRPFDFSRPFFEQFFTLRDRVPRLALQHQKPMINSDYCNCASRNKDCYLTFSTNHCEDCYYGSWINYCKNCIDNLNIEECEWCYECVSSRESYGLRYCRDCFHCSDSFFLRNCTGCSQCFGSSNQVNKRHMVFNEQKTKKEYEDFLRSVQTGSFREMEAAPGKIDDLLHDLIVKEIHGTNLENCIGDYLRNCKNCYYSFDCDNGEDLRYCMCLNKAKNSMDHSYWGQHSERLYECQACGYQLFNMRFCNLCWESCSDLTYCDQCFSSKNCFGCVGLKKAEYCILNKQYTKQEYEDIVPRLIAHMKTTGEWGAFFPVSQSNYAYNETLAHEQIPLSKEEVLALGWQWQEEEDARQEQYLGPQAEMADHIRDVPDTVTKQILSCALTGKPYKVISQELQFYKQQSIPVPRKCPDQRHADRLAFRNPRKLWNRECAKCKQGIQTTYAPERPETVYCEECYLSTVY